MKTGPPAGVLLSALLLSGCGGAVAAPPSSPAAPASGPASPSAAASAAARPTAEPAAGSAKPDGQPVHVLWGTSTGAQTFVRIAGEKGFFQQNGVTADAQYALASVAVASLVAGQAHYVVAGAVESIQAITGGAPLKMIAFNQDQNPYGLFAQPDVASVQALKGKTVAVGTRGDTSDISLRIALGPSGLAVDKDVNARSIGNSPARWAALSSHQIDAAILDEDQYISQARKQGMQLLVSLSQQHIPYAAGGIEVNANFARANPETTLGVLKALVQAGRFVQDPKNRAETMAAMAKDLQRSADDPLVADVYATESKKTPMKLPYPEAIDTILSALRSIDSARYGSITSEQVLDPSFMNTLRSQGFLTPAESGKS